MYIVPLHRSVDPQEGQLRAVGGHLECCGHIRVRMRSRGLVVVPGGSAAPEGMLPHGPADAIRMQYLLAQRGRVVPDPGVVAHESRPWRAADTHAREPVVLLVLFAQRPRTVVAVVTDYVVTIVLPLVEVVLARPRVQFTPAAIVLAFGREEADVARQHLCFAQPRALAHCLLLVALPTLIHFAPQRTLCVALVLPRAAAHRGEHENIPCLGSPFSNMRMPGAPDGTHSFAQDRRAFFTPAEPCRLAIVHSHHMQPPVTRDPELGHPPYHPTASRSRFRPSIP